MNYQLTGLREHHLNISNTELNWKNNVPQIAWSFGIDFRSENENSLEVLVNVAAHPKGENTGSPCVELFASHYFKVSGVLPFKKGHYNLSQQEKMFFATLLGIALGTIRGLLYSKTIGLLGADTFMPVVSPILLVEQFIET